MVRPIDEARSYVCILESRLQRGLPSAHRLEGEEVDTAERGGGLR